MDRRGWFGGVIYAGFGWWSGSGVDDLFDSGVGNDKLLLSHGEGGDVAHRGFELWDGHASVGADCKDSPKDVVCSAGDR